MHPFIKTEFNEEKNKKYHISGKGVCSESGNIFFISLEIPVCTL